jgi:signal recognition particle receptor subunit beta
MVQFNFSERTIKAKVVYYGPAQSGKTTNLDQIHRMTDPQGTNRLISLNTAQDRTLFFDLLPFNLGSISGYDFKIQLYTVPGQVQYNATRRVVLAGADAVVFVADSQKTMAKENLNAFENMKVNLLANRLVPEKVPLVLQYNKQDLDGLIPVAEMDRAMNPWGRKAFPAVASRGDGVIETFVAMVQDMLAAIAVKYNLKEKGLDPEAVPEVVTRAFASLLKQAPPPPAAPAAPPVRMVVTQPEGAEPAYPGQAGAEASPVSEELLHRAIRSNVELAEVLGQLMREVNLGLASIHSAASALVASHDEIGRRSAIGSIQTEVQRLRRLVQDVGPATANRAAVSRAPAPPHAAPIPARAPAAPVRPPALVPPGLARPAAAAPRPSAPAAPRAAPAPVPAGPTAGSFDRLVEEVVVALRAVSTGPAVAVESKVVRGTPLPRCSPAGVRRALLALLRGLGSAGLPGGAITVRGERKPVLLRGRDGNEVRRDFLMVALTHARGLSEADQQRVLKGGDTGPLGEAHRLVREMGGFLRFAPLPAGALETRAFLPL